MTHTELNSLPHGTKAELDAIPSVTLKMISGPSFLIGSKTRVFAATETPDGWEGCSRMPRTGDFFPRQMFGRSDYELVS